MIRINENYNKLASSYLFSEIAKRVKQFEESNPGAAIIRMGIGDVTLPLPPVCIAAFHRAVDEMADEKTFYGYGPEQGYEFLRKKIAEYDFQSRGADIAPSEIFISDGAKCDSGNIQELFASDSRIAVPDPVYPVYVDSNVMAGRAGVFRDGRYDGLVYLDSTEKNNYVPDLPKEEVDLIYLCFPNNPTGATIGREALQRWVDFAQEKKALIIFDAAYVAFIRDSSLPQSIFEIEGAKEVAVEIRSFSKTAGFTGTRCAYTVIPQTCRAYGPDKQPVLLHKLWNRRQTTKFNGVSYPVQRAAEAVYSGEGIQQIKRMNDYYLANAALIRETFLGLGYQCTGGQNSPYIWVKIDMDSWDFFSLLLSQAHVVTTPGSGFGKCGEGCIRISAFNSRENTKTGLNNIKNVLFAR
jgi:LL-diaminopimelate aminotransferase